MSGSAVDRCTVVVSIAYFRFLGVSTSTTVYIYSSCSYYGSSYGFSNSFCNCGGNIQCVISVANNPQNCAYANFIAPNNAALPPSFSQPSYSFTATTCNAGSTVGFVTASNAPTSYVINGNTNFAINNNGLITTNYLLTPGTQSFMVQATNVYGTTYTAVTVAVACGSGLGGVFGINGANNGVFPPIGLGSTGYGAPIFSQSAYRYGKSVLEILALSGSRHRRWTTSMILTCAFASLAGFRGRNYKEQAQPKKSCHRRRVPSTVRTLSSEFWLPIPIFWFYITRRRMSQGVWMLHGIEVSWHRMARSRKTKTMWYGKLIVVAHARRNHQPSRQYGFKSWCPLNSGFQELSIKTAER